MNTINENEINTEFQLDNDNDNYDSKTYLVYDEQTEINDEISMMNFHVNKDSGEWLDAKTIISHQDNTRTEFLWDYLASRFELNNDNFDNIRNVYYKDNFLNIVCEFTETTSKYLIDNLKIKKFVPKGYIFSTSDKLNEWNFTITIITTMGIYTANRYVDENMIGWY